MNKNKKDLIRKVISFLSIFIFVPSVLTVELLTNSPNFAIISIAVIIFSIIPFFLLFENRRPNAEKIVAVAVMSSLAITARVAFYFVPQFKPMLAIVIIAGVAFGCEFGFLTGALTMLCSNFIFGHGPWSPWQMFACGLVGFISGLLSKSKKTQNTIIICIWGFVSGYLYGFIVDTWSFLGFSQSLSLHSAITVYSAGFLFNTVLAISTVIFLAIGSKEILYRLDRIKTKYGLFFDTTKHKLFADNFYDKER